jgi:hypothetical protein
VEGVAESDADTNHPVRLIVVTINIPCRNFR